MCKIYLLNNNSTPKTYNNKNITTKTSKMSVNVSTNKTDSIIGIGPKTLIGEIVAEYPFIKEFLGTLSTDYKRLSNPVVFKTMKNIATLDMISKVGGFKVDHLIKLIKQEIEDKE